MDSIGEKYINKIVCGDCLEVLKEFPDNSVDSVVTDPPYGISFMGKKWDYDIPKVAIWEEVLRVLKPGGHILVACGTRTQHRMAVNIEDAGFEIRDLIAWLYGSGFPKSLNVGKAVDKLQGNEREVVCEYDRRSKYDGCERKEHTNRPEQFDIGKSTITKHTKGTSEWEGWGTALKPAMELFTLARRPLSEKTVAQNVLKHRTGGLNVDGCRVEHITVNGGNLANNPHLRKNIKAGKAVNLSSFDLSNHDIKPHVLGRFPANVIHDGSDEVVKGFPDAQSSGRYGESGDKKPKGIWGIGSIRQQTYFDNGSAARFFYVAKASKAERNRGLEGMPENQTTGGGGLTANKRDDGSYETASAGGKYGSIKALQQNTHPTVKPIALMRYLCRLITPPKGLILDCFCGSGSTLIAAKIEGFDFVGIDNDSDSVEIAEHRLAGVTPMMELEF